MLQRFLLLWLTILSLVAYVWPRWVSALDPFVSSKPYLPYLFAITMFAIGSLLPRDEVRQVMKRWPTVLGGTAIQYTVMPILAYGMAHVFGLTGNVLIGVVMVGCVPGAMASNVLTLTARGNVSYSVSLTTSATLLSPLAVPAFLYLMLQQSDVDQAQLALDAFQLLLMQVVGPVIAGHLLSIKSTRFAAMIKQVGPTIANLTILWIIAFVVAANRERLSNTSLHLALILTSINLIGYAAGWGGARVLRLPDSMRRALTLEVGMQNAGLGVVLVVQLFEKNKQVDTDVVSLPPALYTFGCMLTGTMLARYWSMRSEQTENGEKY